MLQSLPLHLFDVIALLPRETIMKLFELGKETILLILKGLITLR